MTTQNFLHIIVNCNGHVFSFIKEIDYIEFITSKKYKEFSSKYGEILIANSKLLPYHTLQSRFNMTISYNDRSLNIEEILLGIIKDVLTLLGCNEKFSKEVIFKYSVGINNEENIALHYSLQIHESANESETRLVMEKFLLRKKTEITLYSNRIDKVE